MRGQPEAAWLQSDTDLTSAGRFPPSLLTHSSCRALKDVLKICDGFCLEAKT